jgi:hypothetical protein
MVRHSERDTPLIPLILDGTETPQCQPKPTTPADGPLVELGAGAGHDVGDHSGHVARFRIREDIGPTHPATDRLSVAGFRKFIGG